MNGIFTAVLIAAGALCCGAGASAAEEVRIVSYNIHHGEGADRKLDLPRIASIIARQRPDYAGLQEVDSETRRSKGVDQAGELGRLLGMHAEFAQAIPFQGGGYGVAVLSREKHSAARQGATGAFAVRIRRSLGGQHSSRSHGRGAARICPDDPRNRIGADRKETAFHRRRLE